MTAHNPMVQHRSSGWQRWRGWCEPCKSGTAWGCQGDAIDWVDDHLTDFPPPAPDCSCFVLAGRDYVDNHPEDCPLHKGAPNV